MDETHWWDDDNPDYDEAYCPTDMEPEAGPVDPDWCYAPCGKAFDA